MKKKISLWLNELPDGYRELAIKNFEEQGYPDREVTKIFAINSAFSFIDSHQGRKFWREVERAFLYPYPPLPKTLRKCECELKLSSCTNMCEYLLNKFENH